jgi:hypothetical protein
MESLYNVGNGLYKVFTIAKKGTFFPAKEGVHSRNIFSFFKWGTLAQKKGHFSLLKKVAYASIPPGSATPACLAQHVTKVPGG